MADRQALRVREVSPRVAAVWNPLERTNVKFLYGQAFRAPNLYEQYYALKGTGGEPVPNPDIRPEGITTYEAVLDQGLWDGATGSLALYHNEIQDLIDQVNVIRPGGVVDTQFQNGPSAFGQGAEFELRSPLPYGMSGRASYSLQETRSRGRLLSNSPKHLVTASLLFPIAAGLEGAAQLLVVGPRQTTLGRRLEAAPVASLTLQYRTPVPGLEISASAYNLLNRTYPDPSGSELLQDRIPQDGITWRLQVRYAF